MGTANKPPNPTRPHAVGGPYANIGFLHISFAWLIAGMIWNQ